MRTFFASTAAFLAMTLLFTSGCASWERDGEQKVGQLRASVPKMREYALAHLPEITEQERSVIVSTEPQFMTPHYSSGIFYFQWPKICSIYTHMPALEPEALTDLRTKR